MTARLLMVMACGVALGVSPARAQPDEQTFALTVRAEVTAVVTAECPGCDWSLPGREAVVLRLDVDGAYSQHLVLSRQGRASYHVMLGALAAGGHRLTVQRDEQRSAPAAGPALVDRVEIRAFTADAPEYEWLSSAPVLRARPGSIERFSDVPLLIYVERDVERGEGDRSYRWQYTAIFSNEDGGTPADRLMATWGRTTDIEFVYGVTTDRRALIQGEGHVWREFRGSPANGHPELWVATDNNMVADAGPADAIRFAPAPTVVELRDESREAVMDQEPWTYDVAAREARREQRIVPAPAAGSGQMRDPRRYVTVEACADNAAAALAVDVGVRMADGTIQWQPSDAASPAFRIARGGCFRGSVALPDGRGPMDVTGVRLRAYPRPDDRQAGERDRAVVVRALRKVFVLGADYRPVAMAGLEWHGALALPGDGRAIAIPTAPPR